MKKRIYAKAEIVVMFVTVKQHIMVASIENFNYDGHGDDQGKGV